MKNTYLPRNNDHPSRPALISFIAKLLFPLLIGTGKPSVMTTSSSSCDWWNGGVFTCLAAWWNEG